MTSIYFCGFSKNDTWLCLPLTVFTSWAGTENNQFCLFANSRFFKKNQNHQVLKISTLLKFVIWHKLFKNSRKEIISHLQWLHSVATVSAHLHSFPSCPRVPSRHRGTLKVLTIPPLSQRIEGSGGGVLPKGGWERERDTIDCPPGSLTV